MVLSNPQDWFYRNEWSWYETVKETICKWRSNNLSHNLRLIIENTFLNLAMKWF